MSKMLQLQTDHFVAFGLSVIGHQLSVHSTQSQHPVALPMQVTFNFSLSPFNLLIRRRALKRPANHPDKHTEGAAQTSPFPGQRLQRA
jgi:hypothetical protein